jgi:hypothetical protein
MTQAQLKALFPGIKPTPNHSGSPSLTIDSGYSNVNYRIGFYSDKAASRTRQRHRRPARPATVSEI